MALGKLEDHRHIQFFRRANNCTQTFQIGGVKGTHRYFALFRNLQNFFQGN